MTAALNLDAINFSRHEEVLVTHGHLKVSAFCYASGVKALRVVNSVGWLVLLPYQGQQIWDVVFHGRRLTMRSMFDEPVDTQDYLGNYGGFLLHCGATAMGNPGLGDTHALHGELPNARYQHAGLSIGTDKFGDYVELNGDYHHTVAFTANYVARPMLRIYGDSSRLHMHMKIQNLKNSPMDLMYLAHVNFVPVDDALLVDTVKPGASHVRVRSKLPEFFVPKAAHSAMIAALQKEPDLHRHLKAGEAIDPELVMGMDFTTDALGWAHSMQLLPDGSADFISHKPSELPRGVRWITRTSDQDAWGLFLPGTAEADGYTAEKAKGNLVTVAPGECFECSLSFGSLDAGEAAAMRDQVEQM